MIAPRLDLAALYAVPCRFGCSDPVVAIVHAPAGCVCWSDPLQALCVHHLAKVQSSGPITIVADYRLPAETSAIERLRDCAGWNKCPCQGELEAVIGASPNT